jgi:putative peptide zinc metalloprotease protein
VAQGVVWLPEQALLRTQTRGWVQAVHVADGQTVQPGDAVLTLHNPDLQAEAGRLLAKVQDLQADEARALRDDPTAVAAAGHALQAALADWLQNRQQLQELTLRAQAPGRIALAHAADLPGRHLPRGTLVGHVMTAGPGIVQVAIAQENAAVWPTVPSPVQVLALGGASASLGAPGALPHSHPQPGLWRGLTSGAQHQLPAAALGSRSGGRVPVDPADAQGLRAMQPVVVGEVQLQGAAADRIGQRVLVRFEHGSAPLLLQAARALQQQVLRHFNPAQ